MHDARMHDHDHDHDHGHSHGPAGTGWGRGRMRAGGMMGGPGPGWGGRRRRMRRGDIRRAVLGALVDGPANGYEVMRRLEERSGGLWRPSPGSVYPTLQMLEDEGLVRAEQREGSRVFELTDAGREASEQAAGDQRAGGPPWGHGDEQDDGIRTLRQAVGQ